MKHTIRILTPLVAILLAVALTPTNTFAQNPNFAGNWTLNAEASELGGGGAPPGGGGGRGGGRMGGGASANMSITHEGNTLSITTTFQGREGQSQERVTTFITDGESHTDESGRMPTTYTATWQDGKLRVVSTMSFSRQGGEAMERTTTTVYSMAGGQLVVETTMAGMRGGDPMTTKAVYDKQD